MKVCIKDSCGITVKARGLCNRHYLQYLANGGVRKTLNLGTPEERFHRSYDVDALTGCWVWKGWINDKGCPTIPLNGKNTYSAKRLSHEIHLGAVPKGGRVYKTCQASACVNPEHLTLIPPVRRTPEQAAEASRIRLEEAARKLEASVQRSQKLLEVRDEYRRGAREIAFSVPGSSSAGKAADADVDWGESVCVLLPKGEHAIIDVAIHDWFWKYEWRVYSIGRNASEPHVVANIGGRQARLSRMLTNCPEGKVVDHRNHDTRDGRLINLRVATISQNNANQRKLRPRSSIYKGVHWNRNARKWVARINAYKKSYFLGHFDDEEAAAKAYNNAALGHFGEFAYLNKVGSFTGEGVA